MTVDEARAAWLTADRDSEENSWLALYDLAVPRPLAGICEAAAKARCGLCCTEPGQPCTGPDGYHVARFCNAWRCSLLSTADLNTVFAAAGVFTNDTIIHADGAR